jgi:hypothetical protein
MKTIKGTISLNDPKFCYKGNVELQVYKRADCKWER